MYQTKVGLLDETCKIDPNSGCNPDVITDDNPFTAETAVVCASLKLDGSIYCAERWQYRRDTRRRQNGGW